MQTTLPRGIAATAGTVLDERPAMVTDASREGAKIACDKPFPAGEKIHLDVHGHRVWAQVTWAEADRMGVRFDTPVPEAMKSILDRRPVTPGAFGRKGL